MKLIIALLAGIYGCSFNREQSVGHLAILGDSVYECEALEFPGLEIPVHLSVQSFEELNMNLLIQNGHFISESCAKDQQNCKDDVNDGFYSTIEECLEEMASDCLHQEL